MTAVSLQEKPSIKRQSAADLKLAAGVVYPALIKRYVVAGGTAMMDTVALADLNPTSRELIEIVLRRGPLSRAAISKQTGLSSGSLTRLTAPLVDAGYLTEGEPTMAPVGRPALPLEVSDSAARFVGVKIVPGRVYAVLVGLRGVAHASVTEDADTTSPESAAKAIAGVLAAHSDWQPEGLGVSLGAAVDPFGTVRAAAFHGWHGGNIVGAVTATTGLTCTAANDVEALTLAEHWFGHGRGAHNFAVVTVGLGVGAGAIVEDRILVGHQGSAGMLGRVWSRDGRTFHDLLATRQLIERASAAAHRPLTADDLCADDPAVGQVMTEAAEKLGELVGLAKLAWGPQRVLITGDGIAPFASRRVDIERGLMSYGYQDIDAPELVIGDELDFFDWARGAATLAIHASLRR